MLLLKPFPGASTAPFALLFISKPLELDVLRLVPTPVPVKVIDLGRLLSNIDILKVDHGDEAIPASEVD